MVVGGLLRDANCEEVISNVVAEIRAKINSCFLALPKGDGGSPAYLEEFGMPDNLVKLETELGYVVSNHIDVVYSNFTIIATTKIERMILLSSAWHLGDNYYLNCLSRNVDLAISGDISQNELRWFMKGHKKRQFVYILADKYDSLCVSNIVYKLMAYTGETNKYEKILSGEAKTEYLEFEQFMRNGPESTDSPRIH